MGDVREEARDALKELRMLHQGKLVIAANWHSNANCVSFTAAGPSSHTPDKHF
ncbi:MAG: hypothetical protein WCC92_15540 [Candidatus Korobacteraceae bacterium]